MQVDITKKLLEDPNPLPNMKEWCFTEISNIPYDKSTMKHLKSGDGWKLDISMETSGGFSIIFKFENEEDAVKFKLIWL
jgi:hypothetical protein